jgi:hypothetical protein
LLVFLTIKVSTSLIKDNYESRYAGKGEDTSRQD